MGWVRLPFWRGTALSAAPVTACTQPPISAAEKKVRNWPKGHAVTPTKTDGSLTPLGAMLSYSKACFGLPKHGTPNCLVTRSLFLKRTTKGLTQPGPRKHGTLPLHGTLRSLRLGGL